jgi:hypothetical protein
MGGHSIMRGRVVLLLACVPSACSSAGRSVSAPVARQEDAAALAEPRTSSQATTVAAPATSHEPVSRGDLPATCNVEAPSTDEQRPLAAPAGAGGGNVMNPYFEGGFGFYRVVGPAPAPRTTRHATLELRLSGPPTLVAGAKVALDLSFTNASNSAVTVVRPLDGSLEHWRDPTYDLYLQDESSGDLYAFAFHGGRCGNVNAVQKDDYVTLAPGASRRDVSSNGWADYLKVAVIARPGTYSVWVVYRFCGFKSEGVPLGKDFLRDGVHEGVHPSNAVRIRVR